MFVFDKSVISPSNREQLKQEDREYWSKAPYAEKLATVTYLRECFYGEKASSGSIQGTYTLLKHKRR